MKTITHIFLDATLCLLATFFLFTSCEKPEPEPSAQTISANESGIYILNEGIWNMNNSTISFYNSATGTVYPDLFFTTNRRALGDTGNDLQAYGDKLYCIVNTSETIEVMQLSNCKSLHQIPLTGKSPRHIAFSGQYGYVTCYDGSVVKIDTATFEIVGSAQAGRNPEGICITNGKIYVANSGGLDSPNYDHTVSVFDVNNLSLINTIEVVCNPNWLLADDEGDIYLVSYGNYSTIPSTFQRISSQSDEVVETFDFAVTKFTINGHTAYLYNNDFATGQNTFMVMDLHTERLTSTDFISDGTTISSPYCIFVHPNTGDVFIGDAGNYTVNGDIYCFTANGQKKYSFETGLNPSCITVKAAR